MTADEIWYTARELFSYRPTPETNQITDYVSVDTVLAAEVYDIEETEPDQMVMRDGGVMTPYYKTQEYVELIAKKSKTTKFNFLAVIKNPSDNHTQDIGQNYDFMGYDLINTCSQNSALADKDGYFDSIFSMSELNKHGLIANLEKAKKVQRAIEKKNPNSDDEDCHIFAIWRHKTIGRNQL